MNINILNNCMVMWTSNNYIRMFDLSRREYKQTGVTRRFEDSKGILGHIRSCTNNADGSKVVIIADQIKDNSLSADNKFYIYDVEMDTFFSYACPQGYLPSEAFCDPKDKKLFGVLLIQQSMQEKQANQAQAHTAVSEEQGAENSMLQLQTFFVTSENGIKF